MFGRKQYLDAEVKGTLETSLILLRLMWIISISTLLNLFQSKKPYTPASALTRQRSSCSQYKWLSTPRSCQRDPTGTERQNKDNRNYKDKLYYVSFQIVPAGSQSACPSPCTGWTHQMASSRRIVCKPKNKIQMFQAWKIGMNLKKQLENPVIQ